MKQFKPMLAPNEAIDVERIPYPRVASFKIDGIRLIVFPDGSMKTRSLKDIPNQCVVDYFQQVAMFAKKFHILLDGELHAQSLDFNELSGLVRRLDSPVPDDMRFLCFDSVMNNQFHIPFIERIGNIPAISGLCHPIEQRLVYDPESVMDFYQEAIEWGCDGLILRSPLGHYKCGRGTLKEGLIYKLKPFETFDGIILDVIQSTVVDPTVEKIINELGRSVTSKKMGDRIPIEMSAGFVVKFNNLPLTVTIALSHEERRMIWANRDSYVGKMIEFKGMMVGAKDLPRHPVFIRFREDKS